MTACTARRRSARCADPRPRATPRSTAPRGVRRNPRSGRELGRVLDHEAGTAVERTPHAERDGERIAASIGRSPGLSSPKRRPRSRGQHRVAGQRHPVPVKQADRLALGHPRPSPVRTRPDALDVWQAAYSSAASCSTSFVARRPSPRRSAGPWRSRPGRPGRSAGAARRRGMPASIEDRSAYVFQPTTPTRRPAPMPSSAEDLGQRLDRSRGWPGRLRSWNRMRRIGSGAAPAVPKHSLPTRIAGGSVGPTIAHRLLEAWVEAGQPGEVGAVLSIGVD